MIAAAKTGKPPSQPHAPTDFIRLAVVVSCPPRETAQESKPGDLAERTVSHPTSSKLGAAEHGHAANWMGNPSQVNIASLHLVELVFTENKDKTSHWLCGYF